MKFNLIISAAIGFFCLNALANTVEVKTKVNGAHTYTQIKLLQGSLLLCRSSEKQINDILSDSKPIKIVASEGLDYVEYNIEKPILSVSAPTVFNERLCVTVSK